LFIDCSSTELRECVDEAIAQVYIPILYIPVLYIPILYIPILYIPILYIPILYMPILYIPVYIAISIVYPHNLHVLCLVKFNEIVDYISQCTDSIFY